MASKEVEDIARGGDDDGDEESMSSYDDVEGNAMKDIKAELGDKAASAIADYVKACIEKASSDEE